MAAALLFAAGCDDDSSDDRQDGSNSSISLSEESITAGPEGGVFSVKVTSSEDWRVSGLCDWVELSAESGQSGAELSVKVDSNTTADTREAIFKVFAGSAVKSLKVTSNPDFIIELESDDSVSVGADATQISVSLNSNIQTLQATFSDGADEWITQGETAEAFGKKIVAFNIARSKVFKFREGIITIGGEGVDTTVSVKVHQAQRDTAFVTSGTSIIKDLAAYDIPIEIKSNVDFNYDLPSWLTETSKTESEVGEDGLKTITITLHCDATSGSRGATIQFYKRISYWNTQVYGSVFIKQQNPNPIWAIIPDAQLRQSLNDAEWILAEEGSEKAEILANGLEGTDLTIGGSSSWSSIDMTSLAGLEYFPNLTTLTVKYTNISTVDISACTGITSLTLTACQQTTEIILGDNPVETLSAPSNGYEAIRNTSITVTGSKVKNIDLSGTSYYISYYEKLQWMDVSGCPALESLNAKRVAESYWGDDDPSPDFTTIYVSEAQKAAYDAGTLTITKVDAVEVKVR